MSGRGVRLAALHCRWRVCRRQSGVPELGREKCRQTHGEPASRAKSIDGDLDPQGRPVEVVRGLGDLRSEGRRFEASQASGEVFISVFSGFGGVAGNVGEDFVLLGWGAGEGGGGVQYLLIICAAHGDGPSAAIGESIVAAA